MHVGNSLFWCYICRSLYSSLSLPRMLTRLYCSAPSDGFLQVLFHLSATRRLKLEFSSPKPHLHVRLMWRWLSNILVLRL
jgi:hypothetical protein